MSPFEPWIFYLALATSLAGAIWRLRRKYLDRNDNGDDE